MGYTVGEEETIPWEVGTRTEGQIAIPSKSKPFYIALNYTYTVETKHRFPRSSGWDWVKLVMWGTGWENHTAAEHLLFCSPYF